MDALISQLIPTIKAAPISHVAIEMASEEAHQVQSAGDCVFTLSLDGCIQLCYTVAGLACSILL